MVSGSSEPKQERSGIFATCYPRRQESLQKLWFQMHCKWVGLIHQPFFGAGSETGRDIAQEYIQSKLGSLPTHKFLKHTKGSKEYEALPVSLPESPFRFILELFVDDYICTVIPSSQEELDHCANAVKHGIHDVFVENSNDDEDPISLKKAKKGDCQWRPKKEILGFDIDGNPGEHTIVLGKDKRNELLESLTSWLRLAKRNKGVPWDDFESGIAKL